MASIEQTSSGFAVKWRIGGKRTGAAQTLSFRIPPGQKPTATRKLAEAAKQLAESRAHNITRDEVRAAVIGDTPTAPAGVPTFEKWVDTYLEKRRLTGEVQPDTLERYATILRKRAVPYLGARYVVDDQITADVIKDWVAWMTSTQRTPRGKPMHPETIRRAHAVLHGCLGAAVPRYLSANPAARPAGARKHISGLPKSTPFHGIFLEPWELAAIQDRCSEAIHDLVYVDVRTGLRLGEILVLRPEDVVPDGRRPHIKVTRALKNDGEIGPPKSAKSHRDVTISEEVAEVLVRRMSGKRRGQLLFPAPRGGLWSENNLRVRHWLPAVAASQRCEEHPPELPAKPCRGPRRKLRVDEVSTCMCPGRVKRFPRFHDLRHTHVSLLVEAGWSPKRVQLRVGHANYQITMDIYGHLWEGDDSDRLDSVEKLLLAADDEVG
jgi:integrase